MNFFRTDLNLWSKRRHKLFVLIMCIVIGSTVIGTTNSIIVDRGEQLPRYQLVEPLHYRFSSNARILSEMVDAQEKIAPYEHNLHGSYQGKPHYEGNGGYLLGRDDIYCSNAIRTDIDYVNSKLGTRRYKGNLSNEELNQSDFIAYLKEVDALCVSKTNLTDYSGISDPEEVLGWGIFIDRDYKVREISTVKTVLYVLQMIFLEILLPVGLLLLIYYRGILYLVFRKSKKTK